MGIINKPWGSEEIIEMNDMYMVKKLSMLKGHRCSLQYHNNKKETIYVLSGRLKIECGIVSKIFESNEFITILPKVVHRMEGVENSIYLEASTPEMYDVVRLEDDYMRT